jgi:nitroreductase
MTRSFSSTPVPPELLEHCVELGVRAPSAGKSQGWHLLVLTGDETSQYWDIAFPAERREGFAYPGLFAAPVIALVLADEQAYLSRYSEPDKQRTGLGESTDAWVAPYWTIDASFSTMTLLLALHDVGLGALFFAHAQEDALRDQFHIPQSVHILGTLAIGYEASDKAQEGRSANRPFAITSSVIHRGRW